MKKIIFIFQILLSIWFISILSVCAVSSSTNISANAKNINIGDELITTVTISNDKALNGIQFSLDFDNEALEFQKVELEDPENYALFGTSADSIDILSLKGNNVPLVVNITFKVTDTAKTDNYTISASDLKVSFIETDDIESLEPINLMVHVNGTMNNNILLWGIIIGSIVLILIITIIIIIKRKR